MEFFRESKDPRKLDRFILSILFTRMFISLIFINSSWRFKIKDSFCFCSIFFNLSWYAFKRRFNSLILFGILFISAPINLDNSIISFLELFTRFSAFILDTASILLMPDEILDSESILNNLISLVLLTWVPPHSSVEKSPPILSTLTLSPYFSPKKASAPSFIASS